jgi:multiple sugar transport system substrate-binding protein
MLRKLLPLLVCCVLAISACSPSVTPVAPTVAPTSAPPTSAPPTTVPPTAAAGPSGKVTFITTGSPEEKTAFEQLVAAFGKKMPAVQVEMTIVPDEADFEKRLGADLLAGTLSDVVLFDYEALPQFFAKDAFESEEPYLEKSTVIHADDFYPQALDAMRWKGQVMCIPLNISQDVVYYNRDLFKAGNVPLPAAGWTWDDFLSAAKALTTADHSQYGAAMDAELGRLAPFIWQNGGQLVDDPDKPTRLALDTPEALGALQWVFDLQLKEHVIPTEVEEASQDSPSRFLAGTLAMIIRSRKFTPTARASAPFDWDVAPLPKGKQAASILHSDGYCMAANGKNQDAAWAFIEYANSVEGQTLLASTGRTVPSLKAVAESPAFLDPNAKPANAQAFIDQIPDLHALPQISTWPEIGERASEELEPAFWGEKPLDEAVREAIDAVAPEFEDGVTP